MRALFILGPWVFALTACSLPQHKGVGVIAENHSLLQHQQAILAQHATRLDQLSQSQEAMLSNLERLQSQVGVIGRHVSEVASRAEVKPSADSTASTTADIASTAKSEPRKLAGKAILGRVEYVWLGGANEYMKARVDTGAKSSSLSATKIQKFERNGDRWVRFEVLLNGRSIVMEAPVERHVRIRQASVDELERRPVIKLSVRLGEIVEETEFTLSDRNEMLYPVLLGRNFLQDIAVVDVARKFTRRRDPKLTAQINR